MGIWLTTGGALVPSKNWVHPISFSWEPSSEYKYDDPDSEDRRIFR